MSSLNREVVMNLRMWPLLGLFLVLAVAARAQESVRDLRGPGQFGHS